MDVLAACDYYKMMKICWGCADGMVGDLINNGVAMMMKQLDEDSLCELKISPLKRNVGSHDFD